MTKPGTCEFNSLALDIAPRIRNLNLASISVCGSNCCTDAF